MTSEYVIFWFRDRLLQLTRSLLSKLQDAYSDKQLHLWDVAFSADSQQFAVATTHGTFVFSKVGKHGETQKKTVGACCFLLVLCSVLFCCVVSCCLFAYLVVFLVFPVCLVGWLVGSFLYIGSCFVWCYPLWASFSETTIWLPHLGQQPSELWSIPLTGLLSCWFQKERAS